MAKSDSPGSFQPPPMVIDGADHDLALASRKFSTRRKVLERRSQRAKQLCQIYRKLYWAFVKHLKRKYSEYCWKYGKSPFKEDEKEAGKARIRFCDQE